MTGLIVLEVRLTKACNLRCRHCSVAAGEASYDELGTGEVKALLREARDMGAYYVTFTGGEPLLRRDLTRLVSFSSSLGLKPNLDTNALLLNREKAERLREAGLEILQVSLDGTRETHNYIRGEGAFEGAVRGIKAALASGLRVNLNFTVSKLNFNEIAEVVAIAEELGVSSLSMERFIPTGRGKSDYALSSQEFREAMERFFSLASEVDIKLTTTDPLRVLIDSTIVEHYREEMKHRICGGCTAGIAAVTVSYDGEVYPCPKLEVSLGNIRKESIRDIWEKAELLERLRRREFDCHTCSFINICGGCRAASYAQDNLLGRDPQCWL